VGNGVGTAAFYRVDRVQFLHFQPAAHHSALTKPQQRDEATFLSMLGSVFRTQSFYFAVDYEITHTAQRTWVATCFVPTCPNVVNLVHCVCPPRALAVHMSLPVSLSLGRRCVARVQAFST
jgi:hypothetical protein